MILALVLIFCGVCGVFAFGCWLSDRKKPDAITRYEAHFPKTQGFRGW